MKRLLILLTVLLLSAPTAHAAQATYRADNLFSNENTCGVALVVGSDVSIWGFVATLEYDGRVARFDSAVVQDAGLPFGYTIERVNDNALVTCQATPPMRRVLILCTCDDLGWGFRGELDIVHLFFSRVGCGPSPLTFPLGCDGRSLQNATTEDNLPMAAEPPYANLDTEDGAISFDCATVGVAGRTWSAVKILFR
jgi:hypothetical protein